MRALARLLTPDGSLHEVVHGDVIGRLRTAAVSLNDGRISEAHAMISLREQELRLIALRGAFALDGAPQREIALEPGQSIELAHGLFITITDVVLPEAVLGLEGPGLLQQVLPPVASLRLAPDPHLVQSWAEDGDAWLWSDGDGFSLRIGDAVPVPLAPGDRFEVGGLTFHAVAVPLALAGLAPTRAGGAVDAPLHLIALFDTLHIHRHGELVVTLSGVLARIVTELIAVQGPIGWAALAEQLWPDEEEPQVLRSRLDVNLSRLRRRLRELRIRADLVRTDGVGKVELLLYPQDTVEDRS